MFGKSPYKMTVTFLWAVAVIIAALIIAYHFGWIEFLIPVQVLVLVAIGAIVTDMLHKILFTTYGRVRAMDRERRALLKLRDHLKDTSKTADQRVVELFRGDVDLADTAVAKYVARLSRSKATNPNFPIDLGSFSSLLDSTLSRSVAPIGRAANFQSKYGLLGTFLGIAVGLHIDIASLTGADISAAMLLIGQVLTGIAVAVLTSLVGMVGNIILSKFHVWLQDEISDLVDEVEALSLTTILPVINDLDRMNHVAELLEAGAVDTGGDSTPDGGDPGGGGEDDERS